MKNITVRFWYSIARDGVEVASKLASYGNGYVSYSGDKHPYKTCAGRIVIVFDDKTIHDFEPIVKLAMNMAAISEILVDDEWVQLRSVAF